MASSSIIHKAYAHAADVDQFADMLRQAFDLSYFQYDKAYKDQGRIILTNRVDWHEHCVANEYFKIGYFESESSSQSSKKILWDNVSRISEPVFQAAKESFNMCNGFSIILKNTEYSEYFHFARSSTAAYLPQYYEKHLELILNFILYFKDKANSIITSLEDSRYYYPGQSVFDQNKASNQSYGGALSPAMSMKRYYITDTPNCYLTQSEFDCLKNLLNTGNLEKAAKVMGISARTIYAHIENAKRRLNCRTLFQIGEMVAKSSMLKLLLS